jgi:hypothetical protein
MHPILAIQIKLNITNKSKSSINMPLLLSLGSSTKSQTVHLAPSQMTTISLNIPNPEHMQKHQTRSWWLFPKPWWLFPKRIDLKISANGPLSRDLRPEDIEQKSTFVVASEYSTALAKVYPHQLKEGKTIASLNIFQRPKGFFLHLDEYGYDNELEWHGYDPEVQLYPNHGYVVPGMSTIIYPA